MTDTTASGPRLPVPAVVGRSVVLVCVFVCAACGLVYELELVALASYLIGDPVTQASIVLSVMVFAMGVGSLLAKHLRCRAAVGFGAIEILLALIGGGSAMALHASFAWFGVSRVVLVAFAMAIGILIGAEMPLLMTLIQRIRRQDPGGALADLFAADYVGALAGGLAFPFLLLPFFGQLTGALITGVVNALAGGVVVLWLFRNDLECRVRCSLMVTACAVCTALAVAAAMVDPFEQAARQALYGADVRVAVDADGQQLVLTGPPFPERGSAGTRAVRLFVDGRLRVSSADEERYHEALVHPAFASGPRRRVLLIGDGDGLALREVLQFHGVRSVTVLVQNPGVVDLARSDPLLRRMNGDAFADPRVRVVTADAFPRLRSRAPDAEPYDVIIADLPAPGEADVTRYYSEEFYGLLGRALSPRGRIALYAGPPDEHPRDFWTVDATVRAVGLTSTPYSVDGRVPEGGVGHASRDRTSDEPVAAGKGEPPGRGQPGAGAWGFVLAGRSGVPPAVHAVPGPGRPGGGLLRRQPAAEGVDRGAGQRMPELPPSTLMHPRYGR
ncbi:polyamine aminopropyltransferase [Streptomyces sp. TR06-5]|uniref:polyamine aminopropyltransferase n=1 Tax=unclassified Streptomyces TaxID=2593676 RepID=UPI00399F9A16